MRTNSMTVRTCGDNPHSFKSPPLAFNLRRQERKEPSPELSIKRSLLRSKTTLVLASSTGDMSRLNSTVLPASSSSTGTATTATSPIWSTAISIGLSFVLSLANLDERNAVSPAFIKIVSHVINALSDEVHPEAGRLRAVERTQWDFRRVECIPQ